MERRNGRPQRPRLPAHLPSSSAPVLADESELFQLTLQGDFSDQRCQEMALEEAHVLRASFVGSDLRRLRLIDVLIEGANFSGANMEEASFCRVEFVDCRMSGVLIPRATLQDVAFTGCKLDGANLRMSEAERILFDHVNLRGTDFAAGRFTSAWFYDCDLSQANFSQAVVAGARLHGSSLTDVEGAEHLRDIVIDSAAGSSSGTSGVLRLRYSHRRRT